MKDTPVFHVKHFDFNIINKIPILQRKRGNPRIGDIFYYKDCVCAFDIETTRLPQTITGLEKPQSIMYVWQFQLGHLATIVGRTWEDFKYLITNITKRLSYDERLFILDHNLSYEFQFMAGIYKFQNHEVFAVKPRRVLHCSMVSNKINFYCSALHSNMSLSEYTNKMDVDHKKLVGELDYDKIRYPWTEITEDEWPYMINDVIGLVEAFEKEMEINGDDLYTTPLTSTGYVRRDIKHRMRSYNKQSILEMQPSIEVYKLLTEAFRGGNTHANRYFAKKKLINVHSYDRQSSYPDVICNREFPMSEFLLVEDIDIHKMKRLIKDRKKAALFRIKLENIELINKRYPCPYIPQHKCRDLVKPILDNGRVLSAKHLEMTVTDIDMNIILNQYKWDDIEISDFYVARYSMLPEPFRAGVIAAYVNKTELKGVPGQELYYNKEKNKVNGTYGMTAQKPVKQSIDFSYNTEHNGGFEERSDDESALLEEAVKKAFLNYAWGVWTTAWSRYELQCGIDMAGEYFVYTDTDSVKSLIELDMTSYNNKRISNSKKNGAYATDIHGKIQYMGIYEYEGCSEEFATLGSKKYVQTKNGKFSVTIAGVNKKKGAEELQRNGGIDRFISDEEFTFYEAGGLESIYNDKSLISTLEIDGHTLVITRNVVLQPSTYTLGITGDYERLIKGCQQS